MSIVKELVTHILLHVNAAAGDSDPSQVAGVTERAQYVRDAVQNLVDDSRDTPLDTILQTISDDASGDTKQAAFRRMIVNTLGDPRPQLTIQTWVGQGLEDRGG